jgi:NAD(P)-dependent dehydrogenase (short-subunit alcohol dehydrogenase family)
VGRDHSDQHVGRVPRHEGRHPRHEKKGWSRFTNIASAQGLVGSGQKVAYVAARHGVLGMTKVAAIELANDGIAVNAICPEWVLPPLVEKQLRDRAVGDGTDEEHERFKFLTVAAVAVELGRFRTDCRNSSQLASPA